MRLGFPALLLGLCIFVGSVAQTALGAEPKEVLLLYSERSEVPANRAIDAALREAFAARGGVDVFAEYFDFARFPAERHGGDLVDLMRSRYGTRKLDMVVTVGFGALQFALAKREALFPGVPITYCGVERHQIEGKPIPPEITGAVLSYDFRRTVELALRLQPDLREVVCVFGTSEFDQQVGAEALKALAEHPALRVRRMDAVPYDEMIEEVRQLPKQSMVFFVSLLRDAAGGSRLTMEVVKDLSTASPVPVYGVAAHHLDRGLLGGAMMDYALHGKEIGAFATARLDDRNPTPGDATFSPWVVNWQSLKKWRVPESRVPSEAIVRLRPPSLWKERRGLIVGIFAALAMQSAMIAWLLVNRTVRQRAERALAESTQRMGLAADAANLGMWIWDVSGDDAWMTEQGRALFGFKSDARIDYAATFDRVHPDDREARAEAVKHALETHGEYELEYRILMPDGALRWVSARGRCVAASHGKGQKLLGVSMDVTARKEAELEAAQQRDELGHLSRVALVGEMATSLAHELNQPLTAIVANAGAAQRFLARGDMDPAELREMLADIAADGRRAGDVIRTIKGMVRKVETARQTIDVNEVIADILRLVRADALVQGCTLETDLGLSLPPVPGDGVQLRQVLLNFVINAFDAMRECPCDPCRVEITSRMIDGEHVEVSVRDFGPGLPGDAPSRVFERFFSTKRDGMGMGLAIARSIIESHGGTLGAENAEGGGARFWFRVQAQVPVKTETPA